MGDFESDILEQGNSRKLKRSEEAGKRYEAA